MRRHKAEEGAEQRNPLLKGQITEAPEQGGLLFREEGVRERQNVLLRVLVELGVRKLAVALALACLVRTEIGKHALRKAAVTAEIKAEAVVLDRRRGARPLGAAVGNQQKSRQFPMHREAQATQEGRAIQIFAAAVAVPVLVCLKPEGRRHINHADAVEVEFVCEETHIREQKRLHLCPAEAEHRRVAAAVFLVERGSVKVGEPLFGPREAYRAPVHQNADVLAMQRIDERAEAVDRPELRVKRKVSAGQVAERSRIARLE